jgi:hypothetical protein
MLDLLILAAIVGFGFGLGYGVRDLISRRRRRRDRGGAGNWSHRPNPRPANLERERLPSEPARDFAINLDCLVVAANDDRAGRQQARRAGAPIAQENRQDDYDVAVRNLLVELNRRSSHVQTAPRRANAERLGQSRDRILR